MSHFLTLCFLSLLLLGVVHAVPESELRSLFEFRKGIRDDDSNQPISWSHTTTLSDPKTCPDSWTGISCDPETGSIIGINLDRLRLSGELKFNTLIGLTNLRNLSLSGNRFSGRLVPQLGSIPSLNLLDLSDNEFYGPIPDRINDLWGLNYLNLSVNKFEGGFPSDLHNLQQLRSLDLHRNQLWGDIGEIFTELKNVEFVDLSCNRFHGGLSLSVDNISSISNTLHHLNLSNNQLNGGFFSDDSIRLFKNLEILDLENNQINSELPSSVSSLPSLKILKLRGNQFFGNVPEELLQSSIPLRQLDLSRNGFTGSIREINSSSLNVLNLSFNGLSGKLPSTLKQCLVIDFSWNLFSGDISVIQEWEATPEFIDLSSNNLTGIIPNFTSSFTRLSFFNIRNNSLTGSLPSLWNGNSRDSQFSTIDLSSNRFTGLIPVSFFAFTNLKSLNLSMNHLTGPIPFRSSHASELLVVRFYPQMESLDLSTNSLTGILPADIGTMERIKILNLANNRLSGELPNDLNKLSFLDYLDLSNNSFIGQIPDKLPSHMSRFTVSYNNLSGLVPVNLSGYPNSSFFPGNSKLNLTPPDDDVSFSKKQHGSNNLRLRIIIIIASVGSSLMVMIVVFVYYRTQRKESFQGRSGFTEQASSSSSRPSFLPSSSLSFSNDHLLTPNSRTLSEQKEFTAPTEISIVEDVATSSSPVVLDVYSPDRLSGELFFLDSSLKFTVEELSRAPAEILGRSSHGTLYKATLDNGYILKVKWLRVGFVTHKKDFAKEVKKIASLKHQSIVPLRAYYWGPREQERLLLSDYINGDSLALHLYERNTRMSFTERLKLAIEVAKSLLYLHEKGISHGNLKPNNIILEDDLSVRLTDYCIHRLMSQAGVTEQILNMSALGYCAPELVSSSVKNPMPTVKSDVYAFGVILMELLTRRSAGDIISGQSGAVDLTDWVKLRDQEGRGMDCIDRDMTEQGEVTTKAMEEMLRVSLRCVVSVNERPNIREVLDDLSSILSA